VLSALSNSGLKYMDLRLDYRHLDYILMILDNLIYTPVYLIYSRTMNTLYCSLLLSLPVLVFSILIVLIEMDLLFSLQGSYCLPFTYCVPNTDTPFVSYVVQHSIV
jgi:hypothetical protein